MLRTGLTFVAASLIAFVGVNDALAILVFDDGQSHVIDQPVDAINVYNSPAPDNLPTSVTIATGGFIEAVASVGSAAAFITGSSSIELAGGGIITNVPGNGISASGDAQVKMSSGVIAPLEPDSGGISLEGYTRAEVLGGTIDATSYGLVGFGHTYTTIRGGTIRGDTQAFYMGVVSQLHVYGGVLGDMDGGVDLTVAGGEAHFYGRDFKLNGVPVSQGLIASGGINPTGPSHITGRLTGVLSSGELLDVGFLLGDPGPGLLFVHVPEPSSLLLVACAAAGCLTHRRRGSLVS